MEGDGISSINSSSRRRKVLVGEGSQQQMVARSSWRGRR
jgi:hypothetical protein